jgi:hypothetical protein
VRSTLASAALISLTLVACGPAVDEPVLAQFFAAARLRDRTALARISTVVFEPNVDGIVAQFRIVSATPETPAAPSADVVELSLSGPETDKSSVEVVSKDLMVDAQVRLFDGRSVQKSLTITLQRAVSKDLVGRWIVTAIRQA